MLLALSLGYRSIRELKQGMTAREWEELKAFSRLERIGQERKDFGVWAIAASMGFKGTLRELFPSCEASEKSLEEMCAALDAAAVNKDGSQHSNAGD